MNKPESVLTRLHEIFDYDHITGTLIRKIGHNSGREQRTISNGYFVAHVDGKNIRVHRIAWAMHHGAWPENDIDHVDGNKLNNCINNLRVASRGENARNRRINKSRALSAKGVYLCKTKNLYRSTIYVNNSRIHLGHFKTQDEAAHEYNKAAIKYHGEYACLNPIGE